MGLIKKKGTGLVRRVFMAAWNAKFQQRRVRRIFGNEFRKSDCPRIIFFGNVWRFSSGFKYVLICHCYSLVSRYWINFELRLLIILRWDVDEC